MPTVEEFDAGSEPLIGDVETGGFEAAITEPLLSAPTPFEFSVLVMKPGREPRLITKSCSLDTRITPEAAFFVVHPIDFVEPGGATLDEDCASSMALTSEVTSIKVSLLKSKVSVSCFCW